jgi:hypothetical protein
MRRYLAEVEELDPEMPVSDFAGNAHSGMYKQEK